MRIGEIARRCGLRTSAIRYYEESGLLPPPERSAGQRVYGPNVLPRLALIDFAQRSGFTLAEIRGLLSGEGRISTRWKALVDAKLTELASREKQIRLMRRLLREFRRCQCVDVEVCAALIGKRMRSRPGVT